MIQQDEVNLETRLSCAPRQKKWIVTVSWIGGKVKACRCHRYYSQEHQYAGHQWLGHCGGLRLPLVVPAGHPRPTHCQGLPPPLVLLSIVPGGHLWPTHCQGLPPPLVLLSAVPAGHLWPTHCQGLPPTMKILSVVPAGHPGPVTCKGCPQHCYYRGHCRWPSGDLTPSQATEEGGAEPLGGV